MQTAYHSLLEDGSLRPDAAQEEALKLLQEFADQLCGYLPPSSNLLKRWRQKRNPSLTKSGFYLYGDVGRGKSMLMDLFFASAKVTKKRRVHFHQFMLEIHDRLHRLSDQHADDVLPSLAKELAKETWLLCFDEFHVNNIADAMILGRLFSALFAAGCIIVTTSNWAPDDLYKNGLQRERFFPFIDLIKQKMSVHQLKGLVDHRYEQMQNILSTFHPLGEETTRKLQGIFLQLTDNTPPESMTLHVQGRVLKITHTVKGVGFFNFEELCSRPLGAADYLAIAKCLHTVILDGVPKLTDEQRNETTRLITFVDALYEAKVKLFMGQAVPLEKIAPPGDLAIPFQRTLSRLIEMQSKEYRAKAHLV
jgi:cell division protein ZapE